MCKRRWVEASSRFRKYFDMYGRWRWLHVVCRVNFLRGGFGLHCMGWRFKAIHDSYKYCAPENAPSRARPGHPRLLEAELRRKVDRRGQWEERALFHPCLYSILYADTVTTLQVQGSLCVRHHGYCRTFSRAGDSHLFTGAIFHDERVLLSKRGWDEKSEDERKCDVNLL